MVDEVVLLIGFPRDCKPEVRWMFAHLDVAGDGRLSRDDLYALREYASGMVPTPCDGGAGSLNYTSADADMIPLCFLKYMCLYFKASLIATRKRSK